MKPDRTDIGRAHAQRTMTIELREITDANREAVVALHAGPAEGRFVSSVADSIQEAAEHPEAARGIAPSTRTASRSGS